MRTAHRTVAFALATAAIATPLCHFAAAQPAAPSTRARPPSLTGTVSAFDQQAKTMSLVTGVGYALRVTRIQVPSSVALEARGAGSPGPITVGCVVRVECSNTPAGPVASKIQVLQRPNAARRP